MSKIEDYLYKGKGECYAVVEALVESIGAQEVLDNLCRSLSDTILAEHLEYIVRTCDLGKDVAEHLGWTNEEEEGEEDE